MSLTASCPITLSTGTILPSETHSAPGSIDGAKSSALSDTAYYVVGRIKNSCNVKSGLSLELGAKED